MAFRILGVHRKSNTVQLPLLMEGADNCTSDEHVIDIADSSDAFSSMAPRERLSVVEQQSSELQPSTSSRTSVYQPPVLSQGSDTRNSSTVRRGNTRARRRSPLNSALWISVEQFFIVGQIVAAIVVTFLSKNEKPSAPLRTWIWGYACGCFGMLPLLYWRFKHRNRGSEQDSSHFRGGPVQGNGNTGPSNSRNGEGETSLPATGTTTGRVTQASGPPNPRLKAFVEHFKMALDCFFAVWFVVGNVWTFGGHTSFAEAPNLYRLCIVFLAFSCIGYAMPFILCTAICCCLPCITSVTGIREDFPGNRGATQESIHALPTYKYKEKKNKSSRGKERDAGKVEGGIVAPGTDKERALSGEDAVCCICLSKYSNNDDLRELPCSHLFHKHCVDKWLKISAACPLCKVEVGTTLPYPIAEATANLRSGP